MEIGIVLMLVFLVLSAFGLGSSLLGGGEYGFFGLELGSLLGVLIYVLIFIWIILCIYAILRKKRQGYKLLFSYLIFILLNEIVNLIVFWYMGFNYGIRIVIYLILLWLLKKNKGWFLLLKNT